MPFPAYPDDHEVAVLIKSVGLWPKAESDQLFARRQAVVGIASAIQEWETFTGWLPFLARKDDDAFVMETRYFDEVDHTGYLKFGAGVLSVSSVTMGGSLVVAGASGYRLMPRNAGVQAQPYTGVELGGGGGYGGYGSNSEIAIEAVWGYSLTVPGDVYQAINQKAALIVLSQIYNPQSLGSISMEAFNKSLDITGSLTPQNLVVQWGKDFEKIGGRYKRVVC